MPLDINTVFAVMNSSYGSTTEASGASNDDARTNLIINYLPQSITDQELYKMFVPIGPIKTCRIMKDLKTGYSYGFGFVEYFKAEDASKAIYQFNNLALQHKRIKVSYARPPGEDIKETNLYIQNVPRNFTLENLEALFSPYGTIVQKNILKDKITGYPRGVGFVRYDKKSQADAAISAMNGRIPEGGSQALIVRVAEEHGKARGQQRVMMQPPFGRGNFSNSGGKIALNRLNKRYNPIGGGGGYGGDFAHYPFSSDPYASF